jgi:isopenicillin N synthase-like dioxygenase
MSGYRGASYLDSRKRVWITIGYNLDRPITSEGEDRLIRSAQACNEAKFRILCALAVALDLPESYFEPFHQNADNQLRLLHYPR